MGRSDTYRPDCARRGVRLARWRGATRTSDARESASSTNRPSHRVVFQRKLKKGYGTSVELGGAWKNKAGGITFPFAGGSVTVWPIQDQAKEKARD